VYDHKTEANDLHDMSSIPDDVYDLIIVSQTFEHLYNPFLCAKNLFRKLKQGGYLFVSAPTVNQPHMTPVHYFHYMPMGLAVLFKQAGFDILENGQYGHFDYESAVLGKHSWPDFTEVNRGGHIRNSRNNPDQVWVLAQKK
jgi:SAM-dependent methyltransferase